MISSGPLPPDGGDFVGSKAVADLIATLRDRYDLVLIDSPPLLRVNDAIALSTRVDAIMVVARLDTMRQPILKELGPRARRHPSTEARLSSLPGSARATKTTRTSIAARTATPRRSLTSTKRSRRDGDACSRCRPRHDLPYRRPELAAARERLRGRRSEFVRRGRTQARGRLSGDRSDRPRPTAERRSRGSAAPVRTLQLVSDRLELRSDAAGGACRRARRRGRVPPQARSRRPVLCGRCVG